MTETQGCALLRSIFEGAGFHIQPDYPLSLEGRTLMLDGFDAEQRVGFEYITEESRDRHEFTDEVVGLLESRMISGELFVLLLDESDVDEASMRFAAERFLEHVSESRT